MAGIRPTRRLIIGLLGLTGSLWGQAPLPPASLVTVPTAGTLQRGQFEVELLMQRGGGVLGRLGVGFSDRFSLGMSYGVQRFIGDEKPAFNRLTPEAQLKYRVYDEGYSTPAIAIGLDSQGRGEYWQAALDSVGNEPLVKMARYDIKAIGIYVVASKNWQVLGNFGSHIGVSKNIWETDQVEKNDFNLFAGFDKDISADLSIFVEYNAALDDNDYNDYVAEDPGVFRESISKLTVGKGVGYLNAGIRWRVANSFNIEIDFNDIMINKGGTVEFFSRELKVVYNEFF